MFYEVGLSSFLCWSRHKWKRPECVSAYFLFIFISILLPPKGLDLCFPTPLRYTLWFSKLLYTFSSSFWVFLAQFPSLQALICSLLICHQPLEWLACDTKEWIRKEPLSKLNGATSFLFAHQQWQKSLPSYVIGHLGVLWLKLICSWSSSELKWLNYHLTMNMFLL